MTAAAEAMAQTPRRAMVLAAGRGERMRPLTDSRPKPLVQVRGRAMIDWVLDRLAAAEVEGAVVNLHHLGEQLESHLSARRNPHITLSPEARLLDTGGGVRQALARLGERPFYVINGDVVWLDGHTPALERLAAAWNDEEMDALLLLHPTAFAVGYAGVGDFVLAPDGRMRRRRESEVAPFVFTGIQILHPRLFEDSPEGPFSLNLIYDKAGAAERLWGLRHDGEWFHIGTPEGLREVEDALHPLSEISDQR